MIMTRSCPDPDDLESLLDGQLVSERARDLELHVLECEKCSKAAEALVPIDDVTAMVARGETSRVAPADAGIVQALIEEGSRLADRPSAGTDELTVLGNEVEDTATSKQKMSKQNSPEDATFFLRPAEQEGELGRLGGYRVLEVLGAGGMGVVFRVEDPRLKRQVALKAMKPSIAADQHARARFLREAEATAAIEHDNIVTIYQVGEDNDVPFIAMQLLKGESLKSRLKREKLLPQGEATRIGMEIAAGLQAAHERGLIHRDIKPDNIWLQEGTNRVRIVDFGLVRNSAEDVELTTSGVVLGTPRYMAPEQAQGLPVDHRCDLFSLGSVLYRLVSGLDAFQGNALTAILIAVAHANPIPLRELDPAIDPELEQIIHRLLSKNPGDRFADAGEVEDRLRTIFYRLNQADDLSVTSVMPVTLADRQKPRRSLGVLLGMMGIGAAVFAGIVITVLNSDGSRTRIDLPLDARVEISATSTPVMTSAADGKTINSTPKLVKPTLSQSIFSPEQTEFFEQVAGLPPDEQVARVRAKLLELNLAFSGDLRHEVHEGKVTVLDLTATDLETIWPVRALASLESLILQGDENAPPGPLRDLTPLRGLKLTWFWMNSLQVSDLSPLSGMPLGGITFKHCLVEDLSPLQAMPLQLIECPNNKITDLSPLARLPLISLDVSYNAEISDFTVLRKMQLQTVNLVGTQFVDLSLLKGQPISFLEVSKTAITDFSELPNFPLVKLGCWRTLLNDFSILGRCRNLQDLGCTVRMYHEPDWLALQSLDLQSSSPWGDGEPYDELWAALDRRKTEYEEFAKTVSLLPAEDQITAVTERFQRANPERTISVEHTIEGDELVQITLTMCEEVHAIHAIRGLSRLKKLTLIGGMPSLDLSAINILPVEELNCPEPCLLRNLDVLRGIASLKTINGTSAADALECISSLQDVRLEPQINGR